MAERRNVAVIGCGRWGCNLVRALAREQALALVCDTQPDALSKASSLAPEARVSTEPADALRDDAIKGVFIATPTQTHFDMAQAALEAGKDVFVEKPLAMTAEEALRLARQAEAGQRILMVGHILEHHPGVLAMREIVDSGRLGALRYIETRRCNLGVIRSPEDVLHDLLSHDVAVVMRLLGESPIDVMATGGRYVDGDIADVASVQLCFPSGVDAHAFVSWLHPVKEQRLVVVGQKAMAVFDDVQDSLQIRPLDFAWTDGRADVRGAAVESIPFPDEEPLRRECAHFLECMASRQAPLTDGMSGVRVLRAVEAAQRSLRLSRPVHLNGALTEAALADPGAAPPPAVAAGYHGPQA